MNKEELLNKKNVHAFGRGNKIVDGIDTGKESVVVFVTKKEDVKCLDKKDIIPQKIDGVLTDVVESDEFYALHKKKHRPVVGGVSGGHPTIGAGTVSGFRLSNDIIILSNYHVLADGATLGDPIWQPGRLDGGTENDCVGYLSDFVPIHFSEDSTCPIATRLVKGFNHFARVFNRHTRIPQPISTQSNKVDLAWGMHKSDVEVLTKILKIGEPIGFGCADVGDNVKKSGRTTGLTKGKVTVMEATARINYGEGRMALFEDQIIATYMSEPGDSGSLVLNDDNEIVGLLFAGSKTATIINTIDNVLLCLE